MAIVWRARVNLCACLAHIRPRIGERALHFQLRLPPVIGIQSN